MMMPRPAISGQKSTINVGKASKEEDRSREVVLLGHLISFFCWFYVLICLILGGCMTHLYIHCRKRAHTRTLNVRVYALFSADMREGRHVSPGDKVTPNPADKIVYLFFLVFFCQIFTSTGGQASQEVQSGLKDATALSLCNFSSSFPHQFRAARRGCRHVNSRTTFHYTCWNVRPALKRTHFQNVTQQREKKLWKLKALPRDQPKSALRA